MDNVLQQYAQALSDALIDGDAAAAEIHQSWLMGEVAAGLLHQDTDTLLDLRAAIADLAPIADHYGNGQRGDRWRAVWELLYAISQTTRPAEQQRLARPETLPGQLLRLIGENIGATPSELAQKLNKKLNHISNTLRTLIDQGLVFRVPQGRELRYYLNDTGRQLLGLPQPQAPVDKPAAPLIYLNDERIKRRGLDTCTVPGRPSLVA